ncbi:MAG: hypothetical protein IPM03_06490 [Sulfuritalea sp.]|nr:hypothetical protein [Sulfuritalea sp.]
MAIRQASGKELAERNLGRSLVWRALRKRLVRRYILTFGSVPDYFLQERLQAKIVNAQDLSEYRAWAYREN